VTSSKWPTLAKGSQVAALRDILGENECTDLTTKSAARISRNSSVSQRFQLPY
jgi:hypothetical protein